MVKKKPPAPSRQCAIRLNAHTLQRLQKHRARLASLLENASLSDAIRNAMLRGLDAIEAESRA